MARPARLSLSDGLMMAGASAVASTVAGLRPPKKVAGRLPEVMPENPEQLEVANAYASLNQDNVVVRGVFLARMGR